MIKIFTLPYFYLWQLLFVVLIFYQTFYILKWYMTTKKKQEECENLKEKQKAIKQSISYCINITNVKFPP